LICEERKSLIIKCYSPFI